MHLLTTPQSIYVTFAIIGGLLVLFLLSILIYKNLVRNKLTKLIVGSKLYRIANLNDYLLLNDYRIHIDDKNIGVIDHILITNKYIIAINDFSIKGVVSGTASEESLKLTNKKGEVLIANPLNYNRNLAKRLALFHDLDNSFIKGIAVISDDTTLKVINKSEQFKLVRVSELKKTIAQYESGEVKPFKEQAIVRFINYLHDEQSRKGDKE